MPVITMAGQLGSGAPEIGRCIAERLHIEYVDRQIIADVALRLQRKEQEVIAKEMPPGTLLGRVGKALIDGFALAGDMSGAYLSVLQIPLDDTRYLKALESVVKGLAQTGSLVIRGRGSQFILKGFPEVFRVFVVAPLEVRVKRVMGDLQVDRAVAEREISSTDNSIDAFVRKYFQAEWADPCHYDLIINTELLNFEAAGSIISHAASFKDPGVKT